MRAFAQKTFELSVAGDDGVSYRETLEGLIDRTRNAENRAAYQAELDCPPCPEALGYLWGAFTRLSARRAGGGFGIAPISWADLEAFMRLSGLRLAPWEIRLIEQLDDLFRSVHLTPQKTGS